MKILKYIQTSKATPKEQCRTCKYFNNHPHLVESQFNGITTLSSGYASVRHQDGICSKINRYLSIYDSCIHYTSNQNPTNIINDE
ncbi:hypothetical protein SAMN05192529_10694 [Arachidicoccus rhizosphaerae]|uniref:Uncharacterized protein n=1 Tax=Arachidicoccus rhizosphaerae TaxID=551991 RepID=A0A1H3XSS0_9BACT|nr:hypothetical protein SAMN05192529_10694 [Arachidicoccus rhizosphaerae]